MPITFIKHSEQYAKEIARLTSDPLVKDALGLSDEETSLAGTKKFIRYVQRQEAIQAQYSRVIFNDRHQLIGVITLKAIDAHDKTAHIGTWIGSAFWGLGYNEEAKEKILHIAFSELGLRRVFAGATVSNIRSQKAQQKLPYMTINVGHIYPAELKRIKDETNSDCILNVVLKEDFLHYYETKTLKRRAL